MTETEQLITGCLATFKTIKGKTTSLITIRHLEILFHIYLHEGITRQELHKSLPGLSETSLRRYIDQLGKSEWKVNYKESQGIKLDLIREEFGDDTRYKHIYLNESGRNLITSIVRKMVDSFVMI